ncbi:MAG: hypothetical protein GKR90_25505 [Pseudomonadales bacterium]|nr:hypothetical protein [Pseudomonadales bacterium]
MSIRSVLGEFEVDAETLEEARTIASTMVNASEPALICQWSEPRSRFLYSRDSEFVHPTTLFRYDGEEFVESCERCRRDLPKSGKFLNKSDARSDYRKHKDLADKKIGEALDHLDALENLGVSLGHQMLGDTYGIYEDYMYLQVKEGAYTFTHRLDTR